MGLDKDTLFEILGAPTIVIRFIKSEEGSNKILKLCGTLYDLTTKVFDKKGSQRRILVVV